MRWYAVLFLVALCALPQLQAQLDKTTFGSEPIVLKYADSLLGTSDASGMVRRLKGNVQFVQGNVTVTCNQAIQYLDANKVELIGNVVITQETVTLRTAQGEYDGNTKIATGQSGVTLTDRDTKLQAHRGSYSTASRIANFYSNVEVENDSLLIYSDTLEYHRDTQNSFANGRVFARGKYSDTRLTGDSLSNFPARHYIRVAGGSPLFCQIDTVRKVQPYTDTTAAAGTVILAFDTLCIAGDVLEALRDDGNERYIATGNVHMTRGALASRSSNGIYNHTHENIQLTGTPIIWMDSTQLRADSIAITLHERALERIAAYGEAFAATRGDSAQTDRIDQLTGDSIFVMVTQDTLRRIRAESKAFSLYFLYTEGQPDGASRSSADAITIDLAEGTADNVHWTGKVDGEFLPETVLATNIQSYHLRGFQWLTNRPFLAAIANPHTRVLPTVKGKKKLTP